MTNPPWCVALQFKEKKKFPSVSTYGYKDIAVGGVRRYGVYSTYGYKDIAVGGVGRYGVYSVVVACRAECL